MSLCEGRSAAGLPSRARFVRRSFVLLFAVFCAGLSHAVIVRGRITDALGASVPGGQVRLVKAGKVVGMVFAGPDGSYEIRTDSTGRFTLLGSAIGFLPAIGIDFYGGAVDVVSQDVVLAQTTVRQEVSVTATGIATPLPQLTAPVTVLSREDFALRVGVVDELRLTPGAFLVQTGQRGAVTSLFLRGGNSTANLVMIDGVPAIDIGGTFDYGTVSSTGVGGMEVYRGPDSAIYGTDAGAGVISITTPRGSSLKPVVTYSGDAGNLTTYRNEVSLSGTRNKLDYFGAFSRFDTSNAVARDKFHAATGVANLGYTFNATTQARFTIRNSDSAEGLPNAHDFYGVSADGKESDQDLYAGLTLENRTQSNWHNLVRYGIARKTEQAQYFSNQGVPITFTFPNFSFTEYYGLPVTIRGANGYTATGQAAFIQSNNDQQSKRDQLIYQSDWSPSRHINGLFAFRYDKERGAFNLPDFGTHERVQRTNYEYSLQFQGEFFDRLFYSAGGAVEKNHLYGIAGTPRLGMSYVPVRPGARAFHGTRLRANAATGVQEPTLALEYFSLYRQVLANDPASIATYRIGPPAAQRSRTYDVGIDQNILRERLLLKAGYFHNIFDRQLESVSGSSLQQYFNINIPALQYTTQYANSLAFRAQGAEFELQWRPTYHLLVRGGYTYLAATVIQSFASDAIAARQGVATTNPNFPNIAIGAEGPLVGGRPFRRAPHTGFFVTQYTRPRFTIDVKAAMASPSDDSTFLDGYDLTFGNSLLLPNRNLDFGYVKLDLGGTYKLRENIQLFTQVDNALNNQHIGPIGFPGLPLTFRSGLKFRFGGE